MDARRAHFEQLFDTLKRAGIKRKDLYLAWDFTVASREGLSGRALRSATRRSPSWATTTSPT